MLKVLNDLEKLTSSINNTNVNYERANILLMQITETNQDGDYYYSREEMIKRIDNYFNKIK
jgi:hypothetical protein